MSFKAEFTGDAETWLEPGDVWLQDSSSVSVAFSVSCFLLIVWRIRGKIIKTVLCCNTVMHTDMSS